MADDTVMEEREELMVSPSSGEEHYRNAHFLKPSATTPSAAAAPSTAASCKGFPVKVNSPPWTGSGKWKTWVEQMRSSHHSTWKTAGILDAIIISTYSIPRCKDLIFGLSEKWSPATNSFVFPWGEATITLEDMMALAAYSVLGEPVFIATGDAEMENKATKLLESRSQLYSTRAKRVCQNRWMSKFMGSGSEFEHEAFLAYWLSRFVFPFFSKTIGKALIPIAVQLAAGTRIALAPPVLASIYRALTLMKEGEVQPVKRKRKRETKTKLVVSAPLALVQVWAWERLPLLRPNPWQVGENEPRIAQWVGSYWDIRSSSSIYSAGEDIKFKWRPYASDGVFWERVENEELESFVRCVRVSKLVGLEKGCVEQYLPHRVAMQFGMDQDLPGRVALDKVDPAVAWSDYIRPIGDGKVYVPPRVYQPCVTSRYYEWWKKLECEAAAMTEQLDDEMDVDVDVNASVGPLRCVMRRCTSSTAANARSAFGGRGGFKISKRKYLQQFRRQRNVEFESVPQGYSSATANASESSESSEKSHVSSAESLQKSFESSEKSAEGSKKSRESSQKSAENSEKLMHASTEASESVVGCEIEGNCKEAQGERCLLTVTSNESSSEKSMPAPMEASGPSGGYEIKGNYTEAQGEKCLFSATSNENAVKQSGVAIDRANGKMDFEGLEEGVRIVEKTLWLIKAGKLVSYIPQKLRKIFFEESAKLSFCA